MNGMDLLRNMELIDEDILEKNAQPPRRKTLSFQKWGALAACLVMIACIGLLISRSGLIPDPLPTDPPPTVSEELICMDASASPERIHGISGFGTIGSPGSQPIDLADPEFAFDANGIILAARVTEILPGTYRFPPSDPAPPDIPTYRVLKLEVLEVISGTGVPKELHYLLPEWLYADLTAYDTLVFTVSQCSAGILQNITLGQMEAFDLLFMNFGFDHRPEYGNILAFSGGIFDESLWQEDNWIHSYPKLERYLDENREDPIVRRGCTLTYTLDTLRQLPTEQEAPAVRTLDFQTDAAKELLASATSFENGVFTLWHGDSSLLLYRVINGCPTNESVSVDLETEAITYSDHRFTSEELARIVDLSAYLEKMQAEADLTTPQPPHLDTEGKTLQTYGSYGWYEKTASGIYGIIKTVWTYTDANDRGAHYYDDEYILFDMQASVRRIVSREELKALIGYDENIYNGEYGEAFYEYS